MKTLAPRSPSRTPTFSAHGTPLVMEAPRHCGMPNIYLTTGSHTIGTSPDCSIHILAEGIRPQHAVITVNSHRTTVKALDPNTWVNEGPVTETALRSGDRLSLGPLTFRVRVATSDELPAFEVVEPEASNQLEPLWSTDREADPEQGQSSVQKAPRKSLLDRLEQFEKSFHKYVDQGPHSGGGHAATEPAQNDAVAETFKREPAAAETLTSIATVVPSLNETARPPMPLPAPPTLETKTARTTNDLPQPAPTIPEPSVAGGVVETTSELRQPVPPPLPTEVRVPAPYKLPSTSDLLGERLDEIQQRLDELHRPTNQKPAETDAHSCVGVGVEERRQLESRRAELQQRADELARQTEQLHERVARIAEREAEVEHRQALLVADNERLVRSTETARKSLEEEYARHVTLWQEWDASHQRTSGELNAQLMAMEQRRTGLLAESERLAVERSELQRLQAEHERDRRTIAVERVQLTREFAALQTQRAQFDTERQQLLVSIQERESQVAGERRAIAQHQEESLQTRKHLERERTAFLAERAAEASRREQEVREQLMLRERLDGERKLLEEGLRDLTLRRTDLDHEWKALESERAETSKIRQEIATLWDKLHLAESEVSELKLARLEDQRQLNAALQEKASAIEAARMTQNVIPAIPVESNGDRADRFDWFAAPYRHFEAVQSKGDVAAMKTADSSLPVVSVSPEIEAPVTSEVSAAAIVRPPMLDTRVETSVTEVVSAPASSLRETSLHENEFAVESIAAVSQDRLDAGSESDSINLADMSPVLYPESDQSVPRQKDSNSETIPFWQSTASFSAPVERSPFSTSLKTTSMPGTPGSGMTAAPQEPGVVAAHSVINFLSASPASTLPISIMTREAVTTLESVASSVHSEHIASPIEGLATSSDLTAALTSIERPQTETSFEPVDPWSTATAVLESPPSVAETLTEVNREFGIPAVPEKAVSSQLESAFEAAQVESPANETPWWSQVATESNLEQNGAVPRAEFDVEPSAVNSTVASAEDAASVAPSLPAWWNAESTATAGTSLSTDNATEAGTSDLQSSETESTESSTKPSLPAWWNDSKPVAQATESLSTESAEGNAEPSEALADQPTKEESSDGLSSLRDELAKIFEINQEALSAQEATASEALVDSNIPQEVVTQVESIAEPEEPKEIQSVSSEETRSPVIEEKKAEEEEESLEAYMARLLARARGEDVSPQEVAQLTSRDLNKSGFLNVSEKQENKPSITFDPSDRSHLKADPIHKQDLASVRDNIKSFREVAQISAQAALARHTTKHMQSAIVAKATLTGIAGLATTAFLAGPLFGLRSQLMQGMACLVATALAGMELCRSIIASRRYAATFQPARSNGAEATTNSEQTSQESVRPKDEAASEEATTAN